MTSAAPRPRYTLREYLDVEEMNPVKHEYFDGHIYAMAGGTPEHARVCARLITRLGILADGTGCDVYTSDLRIHVLRSGLYTYPDAAVVCGPPEPDPESPTHCVNPAMIFEVLSPATESYDRGAKREHYQQIESLREYVVLAQDRPAAEQWTRDAHGGWSHRVIGPDEEIVLEALRGSIVLADLYRAPRV